MVMVLRGRLLGATRRPVLGVAPARSARRAQHWFASAGIRPRDLVVDIGAGTGTLTAPLVATSTGHRGRAAPGAGCGAAAGGSPGPRSRWSRSTRRPPPPTPPVPGRRQPAVRGHDRGNPPAPQPGEPPGLGRPRRPPSRRPALERRTGARVPPLGGHVPGGDRRPAPTRRVSVPGPRPMPSCSGSSGGRSVSENSEGGRPVRKPCVRRCHGAGGPWHEPMDPPERGTRVEVRLLDLEPNAGTASRPNGWCSTGRSSGPTSLIRTPTRPPATSTPRTSIPRFDGIEPCDRHWDEAIRPRPGRLAGRRAPRPRRPA